MPEPPLKARAMAGPVVSLVYFETWVEVLLSGRISVCLLWCNLESLERAADRSITFRLEKFEPHCEREDCCLMIMADVSFRIKSQGLAISKEAARKYTTFDYGLSSSWADGPRGLR